MGQAELPIQTMTGSRGARHPRRMANRIQERMDELGLRAKDVARRMGTTEATVSRLKNERMELTLTWLRKFSSALECTVGRLVDEEGAVPVVGYVGAGEEVYNYDDRGELDWVVPESGDLETQAVIVRGDSMYPKFEDGELLFYRQTDHVASDCLGRICIVQLADGRTLVKRLRQGSRPGLYHLVSFRAPEMPDCEVLWAARVRYTQLP